MKRILILLLALMPITAGAQGFSIDSETKVVTWSKVSDTDLTQGDIYKQIIAYGIFDNVVMYDDVIAGDIRPVRLDYESLGYSRMRLPLFVTNDSFGGRIIFRFKENRYKVEVINMYFLGSSGTISAGKTSISEYLDVNFKEVPRIIMSYLEPITTFIKDDSEW